MRITDDEIHFHSIVRPEQSGQSDDIVRFVRGDGSITILGVPFADAASARIDVNVRDFEAGLYPDELPAQAIYDARRAIGNPKRKFG